MTAPMKTPIIRQTVRSPEGKDSSCWALLEVTDYDDDDVLRRVTLVCGEGKTRAEALKELSASWKAFAASVERSLEASQ